MLVGLDILNRIEEIIDRAYTDFTFRLIGADFLTKEQQIQFESLGLLLGHRPLIELLYMLVRQINAPNYRKDVGLHILLDQLARSGVLPTLRDSDKYTIDHAKASIFEAIQNSKAQLKKQIKTQILQSNTEFKEKESVKPMVSIPTQQAKVDKQANKLLKGLTYAAVGAVAWRLFRREFTSAMTTMVNSTVVDQISNTLLSRISSVPQDQSSDPLVYKQVVRDDRLSPECRRLHTHPDWSPRVYRLSELAENGTNVGKAKSEWKAVIGPTHPNCRCVLKLAKPQQDED